MYYIYESNTSNFGLKHIYFQTEQKGTQFTKKRTYGGSLAVDTLEYLFTASGP